MFNPDEIKIAQIKDLRLIYISSYNQNLIGNDNLCFELKIVYGNNESLKYDYRDKYFSDFVSKVIEVYNKEKDLRKINFLNETTEELFNNINNFSSIKISYDHKNLQDFKVSSFNRSNMSYFAIVPYVKDAIIKFLWAINQSEDVRVQFFPANSNRIFCQYMIKNKSFSLPILVKSNNYDQYGMDFSYTKGSNLIANGEINLLSNSIVSEWVDKNRVFAGKNIYSTECEKFQKYVTTGKGKIFYDNSVPVLLDKDIKMVNYFWNLFGLDNAQKITKTLDNCFIITNDRRLDYGDDLFLKQIAYATFSNKMIDILVQKNYGANKFSDQLFISFDEERIKITAIVEQIYDLNVLIVQRAYLPCKISNGTYKKEFENRYEYEVYIIDSDNLLNEFNILETIDIDVPIQNIYQIESINKRGI